MLSNLAEASGLTVSEVRTQAGEERQVGAHTYRGLSVVVSTEGTLGALHVFLSKLEDGALTGATLRELKVSEIIPPLVATGPNYSSYEGTVGNSHQLVTATLNLSVSTSISVRRLTNVLPRALGLDSSKGVRVSVV